MVELVDTIVSKTIAISISVRVRVGVPIESYYRIKFKVPSSKWYRRLAFQAGNAGFESRRDYQ